MIYTKTPKENQDGIMKMLGLFADGTYYDTRRALEFCLRNDGNAITTVTKYINSIRQHDDDYDSNFESYLKKLSADLLANMYNNYITELLDMFAWCELNFLGWLYLQYLADRYSERFITYQNLYGETHEYQDNISRYTDTFGTYTAILYTRYLKEKEDIGTLYHNSFYNFINVYMTYIDNCLVNGNGQLIGTLKHLQAFEYEQRLSIEMPRDLALANHTVYMAYRLYWLDYENHEVAYDYDDFCTKYKQAVDSMDYVRPTAVLSGLVQYG